MGEVVYNETIEVWKDIPGFEGKYQVSNQGRVKSLRYRGSSQEQILKQRLTVYGYYDVGLEKKRYRVHRLVWEAFNGPIPEGMQINHIDEVKTNNALTNLSLMTPKENSNWGTRNERIAKWVIKLSKNNEILHFYPSISQAAKETGAKIQNISACCKGKLKSTGGYTWKFAE
jgi:hypothetical protein